jgi:hypothetical protein
MDPQKIVNEINDKIEQFMDGLPSLARSSYKDIQGLLNQLKLDASGNIRVSVENLRLINRIKIRLQDRIISDAYIGKLNDLSSSFNDVSKLQSQYFADVFSDFEAPEVINEMRRVSLNSTLESLSESTINNTVIQGAMDILEEDIISGASFMDMNEKLKDFMVGNKDVDPKLVSYSKQVLTDSLNQYTANYQKLVTDDLGLKWYQYVGPLVAASRPICDALVKKEWVHETELGGISRGIVDGKKVGTEGMIPGTNSRNFQSNRGGYNCNHLLVPVAEEAVPKAIRIKLYNEKNIEYNEDGIAIG